MSTIVLEVDNPEKEPLLLALLAELDFVRVKEPDTRQKKEGVVNQGAGAPTDQPVSAAPATAGGSIFDAIGIWAERKISGEDLRAAAWKR